MATGSLPFKSKNANRLLLELAAGMVTVEWPGEEGMPDNFREVRDHGGQVSPDFLWKNYFYCYMRLYVV